MLRILHFRHSFTGTRWKICNDLIIKYLTTS